MPTKSALVMNDVFVKVRADVFYNIGVLRCDDGAKETAALLFRLAGWILDGRTELTAAA